MVVFLTDPGTASPLPQLLQFGAVCLGGLTEGSSSAVLPVFWAGIHQTHRIDLVIEVLVLVGYKSEHVEKCSYSSGGCLKSFRLLKGWQYFI